MCTILMTILCSGNGVYGVQVNKTKGSCNNALVNKIVSFESTFNSGNQLEPVIIPRKGFTMQLPDTWKKELNYTNGAAWKTEKCGDSLCISSLKTDWENYYVYIEDFAGAEDKMQPKLVYFSDVHETAPDWTVQFDIACEDCNKMEHCYIYNKFGGGFEQKKQGRMLADISGRAVFRSDVDPAYDHWFDWAVHVQDHVPAGTAGLASVGAEFLCLVMALCILSELFVKYL